MALDSYPPTTHELQQPIAREDPESARKQCHHDPEDIHGRSLTEVDNG